MNNKLQLEGNLFVLVEESLERKGDVDICAEVAGVDIWDWLLKHKGENIKISIEVLQNE